MKSSFPGYYRLTNEELKRLWDECIFVLDASVLLNLYRYSDQTREELLDILRGIQDRLWIPHQAALEYQRNRLNVIHQQTAAYAQIREHIQSAQKELCISIGNLGRHPLVEPGTWSSKIDEAFSSLENELDRLEKEHPDLSERDGVRDTIDSLLDGKVGQAMSADRLESIYREGRRRYKEKRPPGFADSDKDGVEKYGDLVLWMQVVDKAKEEGIFTILVTDDRKDDWWFRVHGRTVGPRPELREEFLVAASVPFYMYQADRFMDYATDYLKRRIRKEAIDEVRGIRETDESSAAAAAAMQALGRHVADSEETFSSIVESNRRMVEGWRSIVNAAQIQNHTLGAGARSAALEALRETTNRLQRQLSSQYEPHFQKLDQMLRQAGGDWAVRSAKDHVSKLPESGAGPRRGKRAQSRTRSEKRK